jgi:hypothetical protein
LPEIRFGPYVLVRRLAVGGMAEVFLARRADDPTGTAPLVVKQILPQLAEDPELIRMFADEARIASRLDHPGIVRVLDFGAFDGTWYLTMDFVDGVDVAQLQRSLKTLDGDSRLPLPHVVRIALAMARACHHAHEATDEHGAPLEIVHRDVSPHNVLVAVDGAVKLVDFGIARARSKVVKTETGVLRGKVAYVAPEIFLGARPDRRADVYGLGVLLFETLAGRRPFPGEEDARFMRRVMFEDPPSIGEVEPGLPRPLVRIVDRALARDPERRFPTAAALGDALEALRLASSAAALGAWLVDVRRRREQAAAQVTVTLGSGRPRTETLAHPTGTEALEQPAGTLTLGGPALEPPATQTVLVTETPAARLERADTVIGPLSGPPEPRPAPARGSRRPWRWPAVGAALLLVLGVALVAAGGREASESVETVARIEWAPEETPPAIVLDPVAIAPDEPGPEPALETETASGADPAELDAAPGPGVDEAVESEAAATELDAAPDGAGEASAARPAEEDAARVRGRARSRSRRATPTPTRARARSPARPARSAARPPTAGHGEVSIDSEPWSYVTIGRRRLGATPIAHARLRAGRHRLLLENPEQGLRRSVVVELGADEHAAIRVRLSDGTVYRR